MGVRAGCAALMALLAASVGVLTLSASCGAGVLFGGMSFSMGFGLGAFRTGCTFLLASAAPTSLLLGGYGRAGLRAGVALLTVQEHMGFLGAGGGTNVLLQVCGCRRSSLGVDRAQSGTGED